MVKRRSIYTFLIMQIHFNFYALISEIRNPFQPIKKMVKQEISLNAILIADNKKTASLRYNNKSYIVKKADLIFERTYKVEDILEDEIKILNLNTNQESTIHLHN